MELEKQNTKINDVFKHNLNFFLEVGKALQEILNINTVDGVLDFCNNHADDVLALQNSTDIKYDLQQLINIYEKQNTQESIKITKCQLTKIVDECVKRIINYKQ